MRRCLSGDTKAVTGGAVLQQRQQVGQRQRHATGGRFVIGLCHVHEDGAAQARYDGVVVVPDHHDHVIEPVGPPHLLMAGGGGQAHRFVIGGGGGGGGPPPPVAGGG